MLECDGKPFFPLQARHIPVGATLKELAGAGFNCFRYLMFGAVDIKVQACPEELYGLKMCAYLFDRTNLRSDRRHRRILTETVRSLRENPALLVYENFNEPAWRPDVGDVLVGVLVRYDRAPDLYRPGETALVAVVKPDDGPTVAVWLGVVLLSLFKSLRPRPGDRIGLKRQANSAPRPGKKPYARFTLRVDDAARALDGAEPAAVDGELVE